MSPSDALGRALDARAELLDSLGDQTTAVRLLHGIAEGVPGVAIDRYGPVLLIQTWRDPLTLAEVDALHRVATDALGLDLVSCWNHRKKSRNTDFRQWHDPALPDEVEALEHGLRFDARPRHRGIDPLLFLDFRVGRRRVRATSEGCTVLNLFAYTCGIGVAALAGGASEIWNVDFARSALDVGRGNARRNGLDDDLFATVHSDVFPMIRQLAGLKLGGRRGRVPRHTKYDPRLFDRVILDPPRWAKTPWGAVDVVNDYPSLLKPCLLATKPGGQLLLTNNAAQVPLEDWLDVIRRCGTKCGRPVRELEVLEPDADFPSFDGKPPLKLAWVTV